MRVKLLLAPMILSALALTGCGQARVETVKPPADLMTCADEPVAPALPGREEQARRDAMTLDYILSLRAAWGDCAAKVEGVRAWAGALGKNPAAGRNQAAGLKLRAQDMPFGSHPSLTHDSVKLQ